MHGPMTTTWASIEDLVRTTDDAAVRRQYDQRNFVWLIILLSFFTFVSFLELVAESRRNSPEEVLIAAANFLLVAGGLWAVWAKPTRAWMRRRITVTAIVYVILQYALLLAYTRNGNNFIAWSMAIPWMMLGFRMFAVEHILMHAVLAGSGVVASLLSPVREGRHVGIMAGIITVNAIVLGLQLFFSWRLRRRVSSDWGERRLHAREQIRMRDELQYARELQLSMLPECDPKLDWLELCALSVPATEVGGDYYDYFVEDDRVALVCGDVAGHGMASGLVLASLRSGFTLLRDSLHDPAAVLRRLHDLVAQTSRRRMFVTVSVVLVDRKRMIATIASAGHPPVIFRRHDGVVETIDLYAPPLGVKLPVSIPQRTLNVTPGDMFVLHSDGIYETRSRSGDDYGLDRLTDVVRAEGGGSAEGLRDAILRDVARFRGSTEAADDVTIVVARVV
jgi:hypothetical protein